MSPEVTVETPKIRRDVPSLEVEKPEVNLSNNFIRNPNAEGFLHVKVTEVEFRQDGVRVEFTKENIYIYTKSFYSRGLGDESREG